MWSGRIVETDGTLIADLPNINVDSVTITLNAARTAAFSIPKSDPVVNLVRLGAEIQIFRGPSLVFWGTVIGDRGDADQGAISLSAADPIWVLERRYFGTAERLNMLDNGGMENGTFHPWAPVNCTAVHVEDGAVLRGKGAVALYGRTNPDAYLTQTFEYQTTWPFGQRLEVSAWCHISDADWQGPAIDERGLQVIRRTYPGGEIQRIADTQIGSETLRGRWIRLSTGYTVAPNEVGTIEVRLYAVDGTIRWDEARVSVYESTSGDPAGNDQAELVRRIVSYAQTGRGKSDLGLSTSTPATGVVIPMRAWQHSDHQPIMEAIKEFTDADDGLDVSVEVSETGKTFTTHFPRQGQDRTATVVLSTLTNCAGYGWSSELGRAASSITVLGNSAGATREEGGAIDASAMDGLILESVLAAPPEMPIGRLDPYAEEELAVRKNPVAILEARVHDPGLIGLLGVGDLVTVDFDDGRRFDGEWRIVQLKHEPVRETLMVTLNRWDGPPPVA